MITKEDVLKAIAECEKPNGKAYYCDITQKLEIDDISLLPFLNELKEQKYVNPTFDGVTITSPGHSAYQDLLPKAKIKKSVYLFSKFTFQRLGDIGIGVIIGVAVSAIAHHFGWQ